MTKTAAGREHLTVREEPSLTPHARVAERARPEWLAHSRAVGRVVRVERAPVGAGDALQLLAWPDEYCR